jgi:sulfate/thiosulfate transport system permease protein
MNKSKSFYSYLILFLMYLIIFIIILFPIIYLLSISFSNGFIKYFSYISHPDTLSAIKVNLFIAFFTIPFNLISGIVLAICIARLDFRGKSLLLTILDIPFSVSPVISGLAFILIFGLNGWYGEILEENGIQIIFALPGMVLATTFVTFPLIAREILPVLKSVGDEEEQAALILGANTFQTFIYITFPKIKWGVLYGVILCNARVMGEFGAVSMVSGHITGLTDTLPLRVEKLFTEYQTIAAFSVASILVFLSFLTLIMKSIVEHKYQGEE